LRERKSTFDTCLDWLDADIDTTEAKNTDVLDQFIGKPFYCWNTTKFGLDSCCFNHMIGLPEKNNQEYPLFKYQLEMYEALENHEHLWVKKAKGIGATTFILRYLAWKILVTNDLAGKNVFIISGTKQEFANKLKERLERLFRRAYPTLRFKSKYTEAWIRDTWVKVFPSRNIQDMRGYIDVAYIFVDESDFFQPIEQAEIESVIKAYEEKSKGQNIMVSTPNNPDGLFYKIEYEGAFGPGYFHKVWLDYRKGLGKIYDDEFIKREMDQDYFSREYDLQYTGMKGNVFSTSLINQCTELFDSLYIGMTHNQMSFHPVGIDFGYNLSKCVICVGEWDNEKRILRIIKMDDFGAGREDYEPPTPSDVADRAHEYSVEYGANTHFFIDGSNRGSVNQIKRKFGEPLTGWDKDKQFVRSERIHPIHFGVNREHVELLRNMYILASKNKLAINKHYDKLLVSMRTAVAEDFDLDKDETVNDDHIDAARLMCKGIQLQ